MSSSHIGGSNLLTFRVSGKAMLIMDGSELTNDPVKYDGGSVGAHDAYAALSASQPSRRGKGTSYLVTATPEGAEVISDYCWVVGSTFVYETEAETRADGRALIKVHDQIKALLAGQGAEA